MSSFFRQNFWSFEENQTVHACHFARQTCTQKTEIYKKIKQTQSKKCVAKKEVALWRPPYQKRKLQQNQKKRPQKNSRKNVWTNVIALPVHSSQKKCQSIQEDNSAKPAAHLCPFSWVHFWLKNSLNLNNQNVLIKLFSFQLPNQHFSSPPLFSPGSPEACLRMRVAGSLKNSESGLEKWPAFHRGVIGRLSYLEHSWPHRRQRHHHSE